MVKPMISLLVKGCKAKQALSEAPSPRGLPFLPPWPEELAHLGLRLLQASREQRPPSEGCGVGGQAWGPAQQGDGRGCSQEAEEAGHVDGSHDCREASRKHLGQAPPPWQPFCRVWYPQMNTGE